MIQKTSASYKVSTSRAKGKEEERRQRTITTLLFIPAVIALLSLSNASAAEEFSDGLTTIVRAVAPGEATPSDRIVNDWMIQDHGADIGRCFTGGNEAGIESAMVRKVLKETPDRTLQATLDKLAAEKISGNDPRWRELYIKACEGRRKERLGTLLGKTRRIVFTKHYNMGGSHYAYTEGQSDAQSERHFRPGSTLCILEMDGIYGSVQNLIEDVNGVIRDPDVSYDGQFILFSWKKSDRRDDYHLYEMNLATREVRQITSGLGFADYEGVYLPNGDILFNSTRCVQTVDCWWTEVSNLYTCDRDGKYLRRIGFDQVHSNYPQVLEDGRVVYTRWDYNDRGQLYPQPLFQMRIDGTGQTEYYGNNSWWPTTVAHARGIPGSDKLIAIATGHHSIQTGALIVIDAKNGRQETSGATLVAPLVEDKSDNRYRRVDAYTGFDGHFMYPYAINEDEYVASYSAHQTGCDSMNGYDLCYVRKDAAREVLAHDPAISCNQPVLLMSRKVPPVRPSILDYRKKTGTYFVQDVYFGPGLKGIPRGTVEKLRVIALDFRAAGVGSNRNGGPAGSALVSTPVSINNGTWDVKSVLGDAKVYEDGSAFFEAPARTPVYFQLIDANGYCVQTMRSWSTLMPGESFSCIGCHEAKDTAPPVPNRGQSMAAKAGPQKLEPFYGPPRGFSFMKEIQPILDRHCVECHDGKKVDEKTGKPVLSLLSATSHTSGGRHWSQSYLALTRSGEPNPVVNWMNVQSTPPMIPPYFAGSARSKLPSMLKEGHHDAKLSREDLDKIACWIDLLVPYCGDYTEAAAWSEEEMNKYRRYAEKRHRMAKLELDNIEALIEKSAGDPYELDTDRLPW